MLQALLGGKAILTAAEAVTNIIDKFVHTEDEKQAAEMLKAKIMLQPSLAQVELNKIEAGHRSIFVAGWRPFIGWVCGFGLAWHYILRDVAMWACSMWWPDVVPPELLGTGELITIVLGMLGLGVFRTAEKVAGRAK